MKNKKIEIDISGQIQQPNYDSAFLTNEKPKIYIWEESNVSEIFLVEIPNPILKSKSSYVHNLSFFDKQRAMKSSSFSCFPNSFFALEIKDLYSSKGIKVILFRIKENNLSNLSSESLDLDNISSLFFINSSLSLRGANIFNLVLNNSFNISPLEINVLKNIFESITTCKDFIHTNSCSFNCLCIDNLTLSDNSSASCSVNLLLETISSATDSSKLLTNSLTTLVNANSNSFLNSGSISTLIQISSILTDNRGDLDYLSFSVDNESFKLIRNYKSGHPKTRTPIMLCFKVKDIHTAPPDNSYNKINDKGYLKLSEDKKW